MRRYGRLNATPYAEIGGSQAVGFFAGAMQSSGWSWETLHPQTGDASTSRWEATMQVALGPRDTSNELNPTGLHVVNLYLQEAEME
jgi:hypothetical protein